MDSRTGFEDRDWKKKSLPYLYLWKFAHTSESWLGALFCQVLRPPHYKYAEDSFLHWRRNDDGALNANTEEGDHPFI